MIKNCMISKISADRGFANEYIKLLSHVVKLVQTVDLFKTKRNAINISHSYKKWI